MPIVPGIERIESTLGPRPFAQYLLHDERALLVDTGTAATPREVILPFLAARGLSPEHLDWALITHADVDHCGGNVAMRVAAPRAIFCAHHADAPWIEDHDRIFRERYGWYAAEDVDYDAATHAWLHDALPATMPLDLHLAGGERFRLGPRLIVEVLHLPGHSPGHIGLWDAVSGTAIITDAALGAGLLDEAGQVISPPPYGDVAAYLATIHLLQSLRPARLLTAHYPVIEGEVVTAFLAASAAFVTRARTVVRGALVGGQPRTLREVLAVADPVLGPFPVMGNELAGTVRAHLRELVAEGAAYETATAGRTVWQRVR